MAGAGQHNKTLLPSPAPTLSARGPTAPGRLKSQTRPPPHRRRHLVRPRGQGLRCLLGLRAALPRRPPLPPADGRVLGWGQGGSVGAGQGVVALQAGARHLGPCPHTLGPMTCAASLACQPAAKRSSTLPSPPSAHCTAPTLRFALLNLACACSPYSLRPALQPTARLPPLPLARPPTCAVQRSAMTRTSHTMLTSTPTSGWGRRPRWRCACCARRSVAAALLVGWQRGRRERDAEEGAAGGRRAGL